MQHARKNKEEEESDLDLKNKRGPKAPKDKPLKEVLLTSACTVDVATVAFPCTCDTLLQASQGPCLSLHIKYDKLSGS